MIRTKKTKDRAMPDGPLESVFPVASSKILDFMSTYKPWDYSITDVAKNSGVTFKTAWSEVQKLEKLGLITNTRTVGNATMYQFNAESLPERIGSPYEGTNDAVLNVNQQLAEGYDTQMDLEKIILEREKQMEKGMWETSMPRP